MSLPRVVGCVRGLDVEILESSSFSSGRKWDYLHFTGFTETKVSIRGNFGGIGIWGHLENLVKGYLGSGARVPSAM